MRTMRKNMQNIYKIAVIAVMGAVSTVLMMFSFSVPLMPSFIKLDFSELPALITSFTMGPVAGVVVCLIKNLINLTMTTTAGVGELSNFLLGAAFVLTAGLIYRHQKTRKAAIIGSLIGAVVMAVISLPVNYFITYPFYSNFMPMEIIMDMYRAINSGIESLWQALLIFNVPFTFIKAMCSVLVTCLVYQKLTPVMNGSFQKA